MSIQLPRIHSYYWAKDQRKSDMATCFIGRGSPTSSTHAYMLAWGDLANKGHYVAEDVVFVSVEGSRSKRLHLDTDELDKALNVGATIVTDSYVHRHRVYNIGERETEEWLKRRGYREARSGIWKPAK